MAYTAKALLHKFGAQHPGTLEEYSELLAATYVRSQVQIALANFGGTGHKLTAEEALDAFGISTLLKVVRDGSVPLLRTALEPSSTLRQRREDLNVTVEALARQTGLPIDDIRKAETPGKVTPVRYLEKIAQKLGLDDRMISFEPSADGDNDLGVRLRELAKGDSRRFTDAIVLALSEAAWVVSRQLFLSSKLGLQPHRILSEEKSSNYNYPNWERGYELAERTRYKLGLYNDEPIESLRMLIEDTLMIPLVQLELDEQFAGATISNGSDRGIVINERGLNINVCVRRMTMCHELGHLLWDPNENLNKLTVDEYENVENFSYSDHSDLPEIRANAFAVSFLAPINAVRNIFRQTDNIEETVLKVANKFKISATAAKHHVCNVLHCDYERIADIPIPAPLQEWLAQENLAIDFFPFRTTPISRRGRFAGLVAKAWTSGLVSTDSAALMLECTPDEIERSVATILDCIP